MAGFMVRLIMIAGIVSVSLQTVFLSYYGPTFINKTEGGYDEGRRLASSNVTIIQSTNSINFTNELMMVTAGANNSTHANENEAEDVPVRVVPETVPQQDHDYPPGFPILVTGLPKSGTTSIHKFFGCGKLKKSHTYSRVNRTKAGLVRVGKCYQDNVHQSRPPFQGCGDRLAWSDNGYADYDGSCFYPSIHGLQNFVDAYPRGTIFMNLRNTTKWVSGIKKWSGGSLLKRFRNCNAPGMIPLNATSDEAIGRWYEKHNADVKEFARLHPSIRYVEFDIESPTVAQDMQNAFGVKASCWRHCRPNQGEGCQDVK